MISGAEGKPSLNRAKLVTWDRPEPWRSNHGQNEAWVTLRGGSNRLMLKNQRMNCG